MPAAPVTDEVDPEIAAYESMPSDQVNKELAEYGIDPQPTIKSVKELINSKLKELDQQPKS